MSRDSSTFTAPPATLLLAIAVGGAVILAHALHILGREARRLLRWHTARHKVSEHRGEAEADAFVSAIHGARDDEWAYLKPAFEQFPSTAFRSSYGTPPWEEAPKPARVESTVVPDRPAAALEIPPEQDRAWREMVALGEELQGEPEPSPLQPARWVPTAAELDEIKARFLAAQGGPVKVLPPEPEPEPEPVPVPDDRPSWLREMEPHADTDDAVDSILHRVLSPDLLASLDAAKAGEVSLDG